MRALLLVLVLAGCDTLTARRDFECRTEVSGKELEVSTVCDYETGREERTVRGPSP